MQLAGLRVKQFAVQLLIPDANWSVLNEDVLDYIWQSIQQIDSQLRLHGHTQT